MQKNEMEILMQSAQVAGVGRRMDSNNSEIVALFSRVLNNSPYTNRQAAGKTTIGKKNET